MLHGSGGALTPGLFRHQPSAARSPKVLAKDSKRCFWPHSTACQTAQDQGSNPCPLQWQTDILPLDHQGSLLISLFINYPYQP